MLGGVSREKNIVEYFNKERGEIDLFPKIEIGHLDFDKIKKMWTY